jgi:ribosomal protein S13
MLRNSTGTQRKGLLKSSAEKLIMAKAEIERLRRINQLYEERITDLERALYGVTDEYLALKRRNDVRA